LVDQVWAEGADPTGGGLYYERRTNRFRRLQPFETGHEDFMTGGWVRVLVGAEQRQRHRAGMERAEADGLVLFEKRGKGGRLLHLRQARWRPWHGADFLQPRDQLAGGLIPRCLVERIEALLRGAPRRLGSSCAAPSMAHSLVPSQAW
jgi:hypothetical protein